MVQKLYGQMRQRFSCLAAITRGIFGVKVRPLNPRTMYQFSSIAEVASCSRPVLLSLVLVFVQSGWNSCLGT